MSDRERRGFASMDEQRRRQIASAGGKASHSHGQAHEFSAEEARVAGRKGGQVAHQRGSAHEFSAEEARVAGRKGGATVSRDRDHMAIIGRKGGGRSRGATQPVGDATSHHRQRQGDQRRAPAEARS